ncbi:MAG TPA: oxidoreductase [Terriglobales bacterium]
MLRAGLIGFGFGGRVFHAPLLDVLDEVEFAAIVQRHGDEAAKAYPHVRVLRSVEELLGDSSIDLVVVCTPNEAHAPIAAAALESGHHVVVDKPFTVTSAEARSLIELARARDRVLSVYHNRRWDGGAITVKHLVDDHRYGDVVLFEAHYDRFRPGPKSPTAWREQKVPGSGILYDLGAHLIDEALDLFGAPQEIFADVRQERSGVAADDSFDITLFYPKQRAKLSASMLAAIPHAQLRIQGMQATYVKHGMDPQEQALIAGGRPDQKDWGAEPESQWGMLADGTNSERVPTEAGNYLGFYENVRDAILGRAKLAVTPQQAHNVIRLIELARESSESGQRLACEGLISD